MRRLPFAAAIVPLVLALAACSGAAATAAPTTAAVPSAPAPSAAASTGTGAGASGGASGATVNATAVGTIGTVLVDGATGKTVYTFAKDTKDSGTSACLTGCITKWPALTVPAGSTPSAGTGVTGKLGTITRSDDGTLQVTYNGLPLYFFKNDKAPGDANGIYQYWEAVKP